MGLFLYENSASASNLLAAGLHTRIGEENGPVAHFLFVSSGHGPRPDGAFEWCNPVVTTWPNWWNLR